MDLAFYAASKESWPQLTSMFYTHSLGGQDHTSVLAPRIIHLQKSHFWLALKFDAD
jgi:hypothetical protein